VQNRSVHGGLLVVASLHVCSAMQCSACNAVQCGLNGVRAMVQRCNETRWSPKVFGKMRLFLKTAGYVAADVISPDNETVI
jgi:hypothetical protein